MDLDLTKHQLVPKHSKVSDSEKNKLLKRYDLAISQLPRILVNDPAIVKLGAKSGDIIKIERESKTAGIAIYYRVVING